ncbi:YjjG family noncanonical pyrimidine nucleotidase [Bacteroidota bacterium]
MDKIKHVFFDLDRTLWDFETNSKLALEEIYKNLNLEKCLGVPADAFIVEYKRINEIFWNEYQDGIINKAELRYARFEAALAYFGVKDKDLAHRIGQTYIDISPIKTALIPGAKELLSYLKPKYKLHIITNGFSEVQHIKLANSGVEDYFDRIVISELVGHKKPSVKVFRYAEKVTKATPEQCIMIGDHYQADVIGALNARWQAIFLEPKKVGFEISKDCIRVKKLAEIMAIL